MIQAIKKAGSLFLPALVLLGMTNCGQYQSFSTAEEAKFLSQNPVFDNPGQDPHDDRPTPNQCTIQGQTLVDGQCQCPTGQTLNSSGTACETSTTRRCTPGANQIRTGNTCSTCPGDLVPNSTKTACVCSGNKRRDGNRCLEPCRSGCTPVGNRCNCPSGGGNGDGGGGDGGGGGGGCPLMLDSQGVEADRDQLRNSDDSYFKSGELTLTAPENGVKFNLLGQQTKAKLDNGDFLHIKPQAHNFKFQISWTQPNQTRYRWLTLPDANGHINGIDELFGDNTFGPDSDNPFAEDGFRALMKWDRGDANNSTQDFADGYIDSKDAVFSRLRLWHDLNNDGNCDTEEEVASELVSLDEVGITYIHLVFNENFFEKDVYGNDILYKSLVGFEASGEGTTRLGTVFDIWFRYDSSEILETGHAEIESNP